MDALWGFFQGVVVSLIGVLAQLCRRPLPPNNLYLSMAVLRPPAEVTAELLSDLRAATAAADFISSLAVAGVAGVGNAVGAGRSGEDKMGKVAETIPTIAYSLAAAAVACAHYSVSQRYMSVVGLAGQPFEWVTDDAEALCYAHVRGRIVQFNSDVDAANVGAAVPEHPPADVDQVIEVDISPDLEKITSDSPRAHGYVYRHYRPALAALQVCAFPAVNAR